MRNKQKRMEMELRKVRLGEIIDEYISGDWGSDITSEEALNGVFCIRGADMVPIADSDFTNIPLRYISNRSKNKRLLKAGDLVIEKSGGSPTQSTGRMVIVSEELIKEKKHVVCSNFCTAIRLKAGWNPLYVYYYWTLAYNSGVFFNFEGKTSGLRNLNLDLALSSIEIKQATSDEQNKLVGLLSSIDRKIALNRRMNATLEAMARQLYDYWFLQFDFPDAHGKPYKSSGGKMTWNNKLKRDIPEGWSCGTLSDIANITMGQSPDGSSYNEKGNGIIFYQGSTDFGIRFPDIRLFTTAPSRFANKGDILMSVRAPVGVLNIANNDCCIGRGLSALSSKIGSMTHLYYTMDLFRLKFEGMNAAGTTFGSITKDELYDLPVVKPAQIVLNSFDRICRPIYDNQMRIGESIASLTRLRTTLLPLLMNGQVSVEEPQ